MSTLKLFESKKPVGSFEKAVLNFLQQRQWPGNVRELENFAALGDVGSAGGRGLNCKNNPC